MKRPHFASIIGLTAMMGLGLGGLARAQGTYYDAPSTSVPTPPFATYVHDTRLWIPNDVSVIRGVMVLANGANGDQRGRTAELDWQAFARAHGFALMGTHGYICYYSDAVVNAEVPVLLGDLAWYATASGHPEVANLPFILAGWSGGGQIANGINTKIPERVIAFIANKGSNYLAPSSAASLKTPGILVAGQLDGQVNRDGITNLFQNNRPSGALWADAFEWNTGHSEGNVDGVFFTFFDHAIRARYPAGATPLTGPVTLLDLPETSGWLATAPTYNNGLSGTVYPYAGYPGTKTSACWLMDADVANLYRGFATYGPANTAPAVSVTPVSVYGIAPVYTTGQTIQFTVAVDSTFPGWVSADVYDGAVKLGTVTNGGSNTISAVRPWGGRGVTAIARDAAGNERTSIPQPFVVSNAVALTNNAATLVQQTSADLNATFCPAWGSYTITAYWGTVNGGSNAANWQNSAVVGTRAGGDATNISHTATGLSSATTYYYTFSATKSGSQVWAANVLNFITDTTNPNTPTSTNAVLTSLEDTATPLAVGNFGYADPGSVALAAVQITSLPALGTLKYNGINVASVPLTVLAASIGNLTYQSASNGNGTPYTTMGIKVMNAGGFWSAGATMTLNVTPVNDAPTSTGGSVTMPKNTDKTFAATDFTFADVDSGDTLGAIRITSLPVHGTLKLSGTPITTIPSAAILVASIGNLTYAPSLNYTGTDSFKFQVRDATAFSADATMAISVTGTILVQNGSFETRGGMNNATFWWSLGSPWVGGISPQGYEVLQVNQFDTMTAAANGLYAANLETWLVSLTQNLNTTVNAGDTLSMTFFGGRARGQAGGKFTATFKVGTTEYTSSAFDTGLQANDTWQSYTFTAPISNAGNLSMIFRPVSGRPWLDNISNISVMPAVVSASYASWATANGVIGGVSGDSNNDGMQNGIAYFMSVTGPTTNPGLDAGRKVTWPNGGNIPSSTYGTQFVVKTSTDLVTWTPVASNDPKLSNTAGSVSYTLPSGAGKQFVRLAVTPN